MGDSAQHAAEEPLVGGIEGVPVKQPQKALGQKARQLLKLDFPLSERSDFEFQDGFPRHLHLREQKEAKRRRKVENTPEIQGIANMQVDWVSAAPVQAGPAEEFVEPAPHLPERLAVVPAGYPPDTHNLLPDFFGRGPESYSVATFENGSACVLLVAAIGPFRRDQRACVCPAGFDPMMLCLVDGPADRFPAVEQFLCDNGRNAVLPADSAVREAFSNRPCHAHGNGGDQVQPEGALTRRYERGGKHQAASEARDLRVNFHQPLETQHFRTPY